tara:strand:+ start:96 stop:296 length:201 start_codon:yes stop_codon:yes gene_type:complete
MPKLSIKSCPKSENKADAEEIKKKRNKLFIKMIAIQNNPGQKHKITKKQRTMKNKTDKRNNNTIRS